MSKANKHVQPFGPVETVFILVIILLVNILVFMAYENHVQNNSHPTMNMTPGGS